MTDFEAMYRADPDPWDVADRWYERRKRALMLAALPRERYRQGLELGCGTGYATLELATRCQALRAVDGAPTAAAHCRDLLARHGHRHAEVETRTLPGDWPEVPAAGYDLIVVSELAYYFGATDLRRWLDRCVSSLAVGGDWAMCHYTPAFHDRRQDTAAVHALVDALPAMQRRVSHLDPEFRLDIWRKQEGAMP
ncbi:methyltransferase type 12 [Bordetella genomosp. 1]|uniref:Methyltransferase type 12 n=1 Tax=Bordetella genomosp. 1 TaxID=1395607 RepID=A0A261SGP0_9BORD|nr:class I SAM-dependent methyltransferase [Bordetella genomosp. 1]MDQ8030739.1 class I SAM-dependent methyltransferase [Bordetella sp.]OZI35513.1 methyltransferase type 12 [Bordetella genomosp. 1]